MEKKELIVIGGGQSALACGYYLRRTDVEYIMLDAAPRCGGAWQDAWDSLTLFSPAQYSSLPGWLMPDSKGKFPGRDEVISYLCKYEERYHFRVQRPVKVREVVKEAGWFIVKTDKGTYQSKALISATGTFGNPFIPEVPGRNKFNGQQLHSSEYRNPKELKGNKVLVVGEGNSGAQILAEVSKRADTKWATRKDPEYLPDNVDGRVLFDVASATYYAKQKGEEFDTSKINLSNIVMVPSVVEARERNVLHNSGSLAALHEEGVVWEDGSHEAFDVIIWCTGFGYATRHLDGLVERDERGKVKTDGTRAMELPGLWLVGYGGWTGFASATLIGVGRSAKKTVKEVEEFLKQDGD